jgi:tripartite-type tricarboxylate transporter receptor subunit TctC
VPYDSSRDFAPIARVVELQSILIVHPSLPARSLKEFIALAKSQPGKLNYATSGVGGPGHLAGELLKSMARIDIVHVPYKGGGPAITDLLAGHVETFMAVISTAVPHVQGGKARALAVTGAKRASALPDVPTVAQAALPGYEATNWYGIFAPANTPQPIIDRLHREIITIINMPEVREFLDSRGIDTAPGSPAELTAYLKSETAKWAKVVKAAGLKAD